ncbi:site-specific integrase [Hymenobacter sp. M29]|uniref:Site-specific integrase n=1 Tax=Hymenobacter mellowenesis TaxID=3063995 RepID=A0ABT9ADQ4_9BACT|nr:site-specific integrase [Hymenobacter sp. M29]MDO7847683.1 site-specific integrase [Hymenobacter sp. M29]
MAQFSSLLGLNVADPVAVARELAMIPPPVGLPLVYKPARVLKPAKESVDQRWLVVWWQYSTPERKVIRRRQGFDLNSIPGKKDREVRGSEWCGTINSLLKAGYVHGEVIPEVSTPSLPQTPTIFQAITQFLAHQQTRGLAKNYYPAHLAIFQQWTSKEDLHALDSLTPDTRNRWKDYLKGYTSHRTLQPLSPKTRNMVGSSLHVWATWCREQGWSIPHQGPTTPGKRVKVASSSKHRPYTQSQLSHILTEAKPNPQLYLFLQMAYYTFLRPRRELALLRVEDLKGDTIWVRPEHDKNRVGRFVTIPPALNFLLTQMGIQDYPPHYFLFTKKRVPGLKPVGEAYFYKQLRKILVKLGMDGLEYTLYGLKHTSNIQLYRATKDLALIQRQNGHTTLAQTSTYLRSLGLIQGNEGLSQFPVMGGSG